MAPGDQGGLHVVAQLEEDVAQAPEVGEVRGGQQARREVQRLGKGLAQAPGTEEHELAEDTGPPGNSPRRPATRKTLP